MRTKQPSNPKNIPNIIIWIAISWGLLNLCYNAILFNMYFRHDGFKFVLILFYFTVNTVIQILTRLSLLPINRSLTRSMCAIEKITQFFALLSEGLNYYAQYRQTLNPDPETLMGMLYFTIAMLGCDRIFVYLLWVYRRKIREAIAASRKARRPSRKIRNRGRRRPAKFTARLNKRMA